MIVEKLNLSYQTSVTEILRSYKDEKDFKRFGLAYSESQIQSVLSANNCYGLFIANKLVAFILGRHVDKDIFEIDLMMTNQDDVKKGYMKYLFFELIRILKFDQALPKIREIWLEVHEENEPAILLYKRLGFIVNSRRSKYYPDGRGAILMSKSI